MCDYSLMGVPNRLATEGEDLVVHRFPTTSLGLASPSDLLSAAHPPQLWPPSFWSTLKAFFRELEEDTVPAVCIPPGARLMLQDIALELRSSLNVGSAEEVTFTQLTATANTYRDAVRFKNGKEIHLQELIEGQRVRVLQLSLANERVRQEHTELLF
jgi:hypothetical protein